MSELAARALIDVEFYRSIVGIDRDDTNLDEELIEKLITAATDAIELRCKRSFVSPVVAIDEIFDGTGESNYFVRKGRINSATTPIMYYWDGDSWETASTTLYPRAYDYESGELYFTNGQRFSRGLKNWKLNYKYGWTDIAALPFDIKLACADLLKWMRFSTAKQGVSSESIGDTLVSYNTNLSKLVQAEWPPTITTILDRYRRITIG